MIKELPWEPIRFPVNHDSRGALTMAQGGPNGLVPFEIKRTYWISQVGTGESRGGHATFHTNQVFIPLAGGCDVRVSDGVSWRTFELMHRPLRAEVEGLWVKGGIWREVEGFLPGTVLLILSDTYYEDADYVRSWPEYMDRIRDGEACPMDLPEQGVSNVVSMDTETMATIIHPKFAGMEDLEVNVTDH